MVEMLAYPPLRRSLGSERPPGALAHGLRLQEGIVERLEEIR